MLGGAALGVGFGMAGMMQQAGQAQGAPPTPGQGADQSAPGDLKGTAPQADQSTGGDTVTCAECDKVVAPGKFCAECGAKLDAGSKFCEKCGGNLSQGAKFCPECGYKTGA
jgi:RNA polymerase subunit RPABC4/transcription elongation factor Spt4